MATQGSNVPTRRPSSSPSEVSAPVSQLAYRINLSEGWLMIGCRCSNRRRCNTSTTACLTYLRVLFCSLPWASLPTGPAAQIEISKSQSRVSESTNMILGSDEGIDKWKLLDQEVGWVAQAAKSTLVFTCQSSPFETPETWARVFFLRRKRSNLLLLPFQTI